MSLGFNRAQGMFNFLQARRNAGSKFSLFGRCNMLTVAVCTYRRFDWLGKCLDALKSQTIAADNFNIIVVDNSLLPGDSAEFKDSLKDFSNLEYIITEKAGLSYARNLALEKCRTPLIAYIDDDALVADNWVEEIFYAFEKYPAAGVLGGKVSPIWEEEPPHWLKDNLFSQQAIIDWGPDDMFVDSSNWLVGANVIYRSDLLRSCGGFDTSLGRQGDLLFCHEEFAANIKIQACGYDVVYVPSIKVDHLVQVQRLEKEWYFRNAFWEGASRVIYECGAKNINLESLSKPLNEHFMALLQQYRPGKVADKTEDITNILKTYNTEGRKKCMELVDAKIFRSHDLYYSNLVSVIYIVTPCLNAADTIDRTILSVLSQAGDFCIRYHIQDGGSSDGTLEKLERWKNLLDSGGFPVQCNNIVFTYSSKPDKGVYDALTGGFRTMSIPRNSFMTWLNADDILMPGTFAMVKYVAVNFSPKDISWLSGVAANFKNNLQIIQIDQPTPTAAIKHGLCDGQHWHYIQQEGTFFRSWLWQEAEKWEVFSGFKYAGDWNLWRCLAHHASFVKLPWPLAAFHIREGQLSQQHKEKYQVEIEKTISTNDRAKALKKLVNMKELKKRLLQADYKKNRFVLVDKQAHNQANHYFEQCFGTYPAEKLKKGNNQREQVIASASFPLLEMHEDLGEIDYRSLRQSSSLPGVSEPAVEAAFDDEIKRSANTGALLKNPSITPSQQGCIFVVTPCLNAVDTIDQTISSVVRQAGDFFIHYHIQDGGSTDGTVDRLIKWAGFLNGDKFQVKCLGIKFTWSSAKDQDMYEAIVKGFNVMHIAPGDIMTWINSDDIFMEGAFRIVKKMFTDYPIIKWIGSPQYVIDRAGNKILERQVVTPTRVIREGLCDGKHWYMLQQEGTFFKKSLWFKAKHALDGYKVAGDWSLWCEMSKHADFYLSEIPLGAFCNRDGQLSADNYKEYMSEIESALPGSFRKKIFKTLFNEQDHFGYLVSYCKATGKVKVIKSYDSVKDIFNYFVRSI